MKAFLKTLLKIASAPEMVPTLYHTFLSQITIHTLYIVIIFYSVCVEYTMKARLFISFVIAESP